AMSRPSTFLALVYQFEKMHALVLNATISTHRIILFHFSRLTCGLTSALRVTPWPQQQEMRQSGKISLVYWHNIYQTPASSCRLLIEQPLEEK
ncbi:MAG: hypothetical protein ABW175_16460, partial [Bradyrhizobium sp.]